MIKIRTRLEPGKSSACGKRGYPRGLFLIILVLILERTILSPVVQVAIQARHSQSKKGDSATGSTDPTRGDIVGSLSSPARSPWWTIRTMLTSFLPTQHDFSSSQVEKKEESRVQVSENINGMGNQSNDAATPSTTLKTTIKNEVESSLSIYDRIDHYFESTATVAAANKSETKWFHTYLLWHHRMRMEYPDNELFDNAAAPKLAIVYFDPNIHNNGLADRVRDLGILLTFAFKENRILLLKWYDAPLPLETFLVPHLMNFTVPDHATTKTPQLLTSTYITGTTTSSQPDRVIHLPFEINVTGLFDDHFRIFWHALFRPSEAVQTRINATMQAFHLVPGNFDATHVRVTHPAFRQEREATYRRQGGILLDEGNQYKFEGTDQIMALEGALRAIQCTEWVAQTHGFLNKTTHPPLKQKIYFFGDSPDMVKTVLNPDMLLTGNESQRALNHLVHELQTIGSTMDLVGRQEAKVAHLQNRKETSVDAFLSTFVDLYIASYARCLALGVGRFGFLAVKISGNTCVTRYPKVRDPTKLTWGLWVGNREVGICELPFLV